jgi:6-phosphogluconolactonase (cycloisomerase 2 family)
MSRKLHEICSEIDNIIDDIDSDDNFDVLNERLSELSCEYSDKIDGYCYIIRQLQGDIETIDSEIKRLQARKNAKRKKIDYLRTELLTNIDTQHKSALFTVTKQSRRSVEIINENTVPDVLKIQTFRIDKKSAQLAAEKIYAETGKYPDFAIEKTTEFITIR